MREEFDYDNFNWSEHFKLDSSSPSGLVWNREAYSLGGNKLETWIGKPAGRLHDVKNGDNKAWVVSFKLNGKLKSWPVHRIIAVLSGMKVNGFVIDHINGISADNRIENLRLVDIITNCRNRKVNDNSPYGVSGVSFVPGYSGPGYFVASWRGIDGKSRFSRKFPIAALGVMEAYRQAVVCRKKQILTLNEQGAGYTERHEKLDEYVKDFVLYEMNINDRAKTTRKRKKFSNNTSGFTGVTISYKREITYCNAHWIESGKRCVKAFSTKTYGLLPAFTMACKYREEKIKELNAKGYDYSEDHGK